VHSSKETERRTKIRAQMKVLENLFVQGKGVIIQWWAACLLAERTKVMVKDDGHRKMWKGEWLRDEIQKPSTLEIMRPRCKQEGREDHTVGRLVSQIFVRLEGLEKKIECGGGPFSQNATEKKNARRRRAPYDQRKRGAAQEEMEGNLSQKKKAWEWRRWSGLKLGQSGGKP